MDTCKQCGIELDTERDPADLGLCYSCWVDAQEGPGLSQDELEDHNDMSAERGSRHEFDS